MLSQMRETGHFVALAPHSVVALDAVLEEIGWPRPAQLFVPVFPISTDLAQSTPRRGFVLQGVLQQQRSEPDCFCVGRRTDVTKSGPTCMRGQHNKHVCAFTSGFVHACVLLTIIIMRDI